MESGRVSPSSPVDDFSIQSGKFSDGVVFDDSPVRRTSFSPRRNGAFWKRRRRSYVDTSDCDEIRRVKALEKRLFRVDSAARSYTYFRLSFAEDMARSSVMLISRKHLSKHLSANLSALFDPIEPDVSACEKKQREDMLEDLKQRSHSCVFERVASEVERLVMCEEATPLSTRMKSLNRYASAHCDEKVAGLELVDHPLFNGSSLVKLYTSIHELCRTDNNIIYKARHRLTGVVYCIKRSVHPSSLMDRCKDSLVNALNESQALSVLRHTNIVQFHNSWIEAGSLISQFEYCLGGSLLDCLHEVALLPTATAAALAADEDGGGSCEYPMRDLNLRQPSSGVFSDASLVKLLSDIASALKYIHTEWRMVHNNVGLRSILVQLRPQAAYKALRSEESVERARRRCHELLSGDCSELDFKLSNFGRASRVCGMDDARGVDVYALAVTLCTVAGGSEISLAGKAFNKVDYSKVSPSLKPILQLMLKPLAADRATAADVVEYLVAFREASGGRTEGMDVC
ncbi:Wee1-like protein kinase 1-B [Taenia crassiceps]|uniref:Wee1-like protein kinase 1-B n=1 Tax=Taenia crassiceps TaxID=6207 RepID=A0ABR4QN25_9CEST